MTLSDGIAGGSPHQLRSTAAFGPATSVRAGTSSATVAEDVPARTLVAGPKAAALRSW